jgi:DNA polymerase-3 subunit delta'
MPFREVVGHRRLLALLAGAIRRGSLRPSLLLSGPDGVGKRLTAIAIAQALNCVGPVTEAGAASEDSASTFAVDACGTCPACRRITRRTFPDVEVIEPEDSAAVKIEQVRAAIDRAVFRPFEGRKRVAIIEPADAMLAGAQNALLKTLEEPPSASVFILVTARPDVLLPTVRSRCAHLRFGRLQVSDVAVVLERTHNYRHLDALTAAAASDGSVRRALDLETSEFANALGDAEDLLKAAGRDPRSRLDRAKDLLKGGGTPALEREHLGARLRALLSLARDVGLVAAGADARFIANVDRKPALEAAARTLGADRADRLFVATMRAQEALDRNVSPKVVADWLGVQL